MRHDALLSYEEIEAIVQAAAELGVLETCPSPIGNGPARYYCLPQDADLVEVIATAKGVGKTGVEMDALVAVSVSALTIYDMSKAVDRSMTIEKIRLVKKSGGKSGTYIGKGYLPG